jgi:hypothetical protein
MGLGDPVQVLKQLPGNGLEMFFGAIRGIALSAITGRAVNRVQVWNIFDGFG